MSNDAPLWIMSAQSRAGSGAGRSAAPPRDRPARASALPPRWAYWRLMKSAPPWKLAALSLDLEPMSIAPADPDTFPDAAVYGRFNLIHEAIKRRFGEQEHRLVNLAEFIRWAASIALELPPQLRALADPPTPARTRR